jgi:hypothetical protein
MVEAMVGTVVDMMITMVIKSAVVSQMRPVPIQANRLLLDSTELEGFGA